MRLSVKDIALFLNVSEKTIYRWVAEDKIPAYRVNDQFRFERSEIVEWAAANRVDVSPAACLEPDEEVLPFPSVTDALQTGGIFYRVEGRDSASALRAIVQALRLPRGVDPDFVFDILHVREQMGSTGVGDGIAIPHPRNPMLLHVDEPSVTLCFLEHPIEFGALDGKPVFALFTILSPTARAHLRLLSRISYALHDSCFRAAVQREANRETLFSELRRIEASLVNPESCVRGAAT